MSWPNAVPSAVWGLGFLHVCQNGANELMRGLPSLGHWDVIPSLLIVTE